MSDSNSPSHRGAKARRKFIDEESNFRGRYSRSVFSTLRHAYGPFRYRILALLLVGFLGRMLLLANANLVAAWADRLAGDKSSSIWAQALSGWTGEDFLWLLSSVTAAGFLLTSCYRVFFSRLSAVAVSLLYDEVTRRTSRLPMRFFDTQPVGRVVTRFSSDYGNVFRLFGGPLAEFFAIVFDLVAMAILIAMAEPWFFFLYVFVSSLQAGVYWLNKDRIRTERRALAAIRSPSISHFAETAQGALPIRVFNRVETFFQRFRQLNHDYIQQRVRTSWVLYVFGLQMGALTALLFLATGALGWWMVDNGRASVGAVGVAFAFIMLSAASVQAFFEWMAQFEEAMTGVERLDDYLRRDLEGGSRLPAVTRFELGQAGQPRYSADDEAQAKRERLSLQAAAPVEVRDLRFRYAPELPLVLRDVNFRIHAGEKVGIVGRTGSGKSSLIQALFRFYPIEKGEILIDGRTANVQHREGEGCDLSVYRRAIAYIAQDPILFRGPLRENLDLEHRHSDARLIEALRRVDLESWFKSLPRGLDTMIEEKGKNLSAGERQLLCMARCLLQEAPVVVMDEATSSIDPQTEDVLVRATEEFFADRTQIIIAHRLSTLIHCDRILWMHQGQVKMLDKPEVVLPLFRAFAQAER
jgi:ABC-type multidrug transport system fused ATPase/permease subunit